MLEKAFLGVVLIVALVAVVRMVMRMVRSGGDSSKPPSCAACPFDSKCEMQSKQHADGCGSETGE